MPTSKRTRRAAAIKRNSAIIRHRQNAPPRLYGLDAAVAKLRTRAQAGQQLTAAQRRLLDQHGGTWPRSFD